MSIRVHALAKNLGLSSKDLLAKLKKLNVKVKGHMSSLDDETAQIIREELKSKPKSKPKAKPKPKVDKPASVKKPDEKKPDEKELKELQIKIPLTVKELAVKMSLKPTDLIKTLMKMKIMATINQSLDEETVKKVGEEFGFNLGRLPTLEEEFLERHKEKDTSGKLVARAPVVTFMGHVDHGKTSLLDLIRKTKVAAREAGGITQHIGASEVEVDGKRITFLDTPGHEAFTAMRARGANATDIVVLVVAANDGVMPQTIEAIDHARAADVPIVVAINKCDLPNINIARVKAQLSQHDLVAEDMGGKTITVNVSAKTGQGIDDLLEMILLEGEMLELKANPNRPARGIVVESKLSRGMGPTATILIQNGSLKVGDVLICGDYYARVKSMLNDHREQIKEAHPSNALEISGLTGVPEAGDAFYVVEDEKKAREFSLQRLEEKRLKGAVAITHISLEDLYSQVKEGKIKELNIIVKADVQGSLQALIESLQKLSSKEIAIKVIHSGVGNVNVSDIVLAAASNAVVIGFHVGTESRAQAAAEKEKVDIRLYNIIYEVTADIKSALEGMLEPHIKEVFLGRAQVRQIFKVSKIGNVAGCMVLAGKMVLHAPCRVVRSNEEIFRGKISSLKKFKENVKEMNAGSECGIAVANFKTIRVADIIECFEIEKVARRL
ncbi:MAG: translation initiation factor IF-2 [Candidatus Omnitrophota bacterium]|nr:MAG: translation initiation factor IF-2 [Candidatus Omnitrophota bacterium]